MLNKVLSTFLFENDEVMCMGMDVVRLKVKELMYWTGLRGRRT